MNKTLLLIILFFLVFIKLGFGQSRTYFDFDEVIVDNFSSWAGATWEGVVANPSKTGINTSENAGLTTTGTETWDGINFGLGGTTIDLTETQIFTMDVYSAEAGFITMQLINGDKSIKLNAEAEYTTPGAWQTLTFDFTGGLNHTYSSITFWFDSKNKIQGKEWYIDNLQGPELTSEEYQLTDATLSALTVDVGTLNPAFTPATTSYALTVPAGTVTVNVTATASNENATVSGDGAIDVSSGSETVSIVVTAEDGTTTSTYTIAVTVAPEDTDPGHTYFDYETVIVDNFTSWQGATWEGVVANPSKTGVNASDNVGLTTSGTETWAGINFGLGATIDLSETQVFTMDVYSAEAGFMTMQLINGGDKLNAEAEYTMPGEWQTLMFDFSGGLTDTYSSITFWIDSKSTIQGKEWYIDNLEGPGLTPEDEPSADATLAALTVDVGALNPAFSPATTSYTLQAPAGTTTVNVAATANNENATVSGSGAVDVSAGSATVSIEVTAEDGATTSTYTIAITVASEEETSADATLSALTVDVGTLNPAFTPATTSYALTVPAGTTSVNVAATANNENATVSGSGAIDVSAGSATASIEVTAEDGTTTSTYTIAITVAPSADATLSALTADAGTLTPEFSPDTKSYTLKVPAGTTTVNVAATANNENATVSGDGAIDVSAGSATVSIGVTAEDGATMITYIVEVTVVAEGEDKIPHPGHYVTLETNYTVDDLEDVLATPGLKGVQIRYTWKSLETAQGNYYFSKIDTALQMASDAGKYLIVFPVDKSFRAGERYTPEYLWEEYTAPTGRAENGEKGYISTRWDDFVVDRMSLLMDTLADRFDRKPWFEGVAFQESATGLTDNNKVEYNYTPEKYRDALIEMLIRAKNSFENSQVFWYMNYLEGGRSYIGDIADTIAQYDILMGGPDILPDKENLHDMVYAFYEEFKDKMDLFCSVQNDSYHHRRADDPEKFWTMEDIFLWGRDNLYIDYCFWNYVTWKFEEGAYTWEDAKPVILKYADFDAAEPEPEPDQSAQAPFGESPLSIPGKIQAEDFDNGGERVAFSSQTNTNTGVTDYRPEAAIVGLEKQEDGAVTVGFTGQDEWLEYTVDVAAGIYNIVIAYATGIEDISDQRGIKLFLEGVEILDFDTALVGGNWASYVTDTIKNVALPETTGGILRVQWKTDGFNLDYLEFNKQLIMSAADIQGSALQLKCYANPFKENVTFEFDLKKQSNVDLTIYDMSGRKQYFYKNDAMNPGKRQLVWNGRNDRGIVVADGIYFVKLYINGQLLIKKIIKN